MFPVGTQRAATTCCDAPPADAGWRTDTCENLRIRLVDDSEVARHVPSRMRAHTRTPANRNAGPSEKIRIAHLDERKAARWPAHRRSDGPLLAPRSGSLDNESSAPH